MHDAQHHLDDTQHPRIVYDADSTEPFVVVSDHLADCPDEPDDTPATTPSLPRHHPRQMTAVDEEVVRTTIADQPPEVEVTVTVGLLRRLFADRDAAVTRAHALRDVAQQGCRGLLDVVGEVDPAVDLSSDFSVGDLTEQGIEAVRALTLRCARAEKDARDAQALVEMVCSVGPVAG